MFDLNFATQQLKHDKILKNREDEKKTDFSNINV